MSDLINIFNYEGKTLRTFIVNGELEFVARDVCDILGITPMQTRRLDEDEKGLRNTQTPGGDQQLLTLTESGFYTLAMGSRKPGAKKFRRWVAHEVIPSIRKHGAYITPATLDNMIASPEFGIRLLTALKEEQEKVKSLSAKVEADEPKVLFADSVAESPGSILVRELATILSQNGIDTGQNRLFEWLRENDYLIKRRGVDYNMPTQRSMDLGLFTVHETLVAHPENGIVVPRLAKTVRVTGKGQLYFVNKFLGKGRVPA